VPYLVAQVLASIVASLAVLAITGKSFAPAPAPGASVVAVLLIEILFTFALVLVILNTATARATDGNSYFGLAIGFTVMAGAFAGGGISGGVFNPAVGLGPILVHAIQGSGTWTHLWYYIVGPLVGGTRCCT